jgi:hypothetical protein
MATLALTMSPPTVYGPGQKACGIAMCLAGFAMPFIAWRELYEAKRGQ